jgi:membrane protease YdiL (CAAX protease family)
MIDYLEFARRGRIVWWRYLLTLVLAVPMAGLILLVPLGTLMLLHVLPPDFAAALQRPERGAVFFSGVAVTFGALAIGLAAAAYLIQGKRFSDIVGRWRWSFYFGGAAVWFAVQLFLALIDVAIAPHGFSVKADTATIFVAFWAFIALGIQTFSEEFIFRGYLTQAFLLATGKPVPAAIASGLLFGSMHLANGTVQAINAVVFGIVCSLIAIRTGGIALTSGLHLVNNYFGAIILVSASDVFKGSPGFFTQDTPQLIWSDLALAIAALLVVGWLALRTRILSPGPEITLRH